MTFETSLRFGRAAESVIARFLMNRGNMLLPAYEKLFDDRKGPRVFSPCRNLVAPDFLTWRGQKACWVEAKHKTAFTWHRISEQWVTGIDLHHYEDYCNLLDSSPWPIWLLFLHVGGGAKDSPVGSPAGLFGNDLSYLRQNVNHTHYNWGNHGMVYWAERHLKLLAPLGELNESGSG